MYTGDRLSLLSRIPTIWILVSVAVVTLAADQVTKYLIRANLAIGESWPREGFFRITHGTNTGTVGGLFPNQTLLLTIASVVAIGFIIYFYRAHMRADMALGAECRTAVGRSVWKPYRQIGSSEGYRLHRRGPMADIQHR